MTPSSSPPSPDQLTEAELRVACAEADHPEWRAISYEISSGIVVEWVKGDAGFLRGTLTEKCPNYPASIDAVREAVMRKDTEFRSLFQLQLAKQVKAQSLLFVELPPLEWARAFVTVWRSLNHK